MSSESEEFPTKNNKNRCKVEETTTPTPTLDSHAHSHAHCPDRKGDEELSESREHEKARAV